MPTRKPDPSRTAQTGGITILVALMLLVLLTIATLGMSKNAVREIVATGFSRQTASTRSVADSGIEWAVYWLDWQNAPNGTGSAAKLLATELSLLQNPALAGVPTDISTNTQPYVPGGALAADLQWTNPLGAVEGFTIGLTYMGKLPVTNMSQGNGAGSFAPASGTTNKQAPDLWAVRSDAQVVTGPVTFTHAQEAWVSTPAQ